MLIINIRDLLQEWKLLFNIFGVRRTGVEEISTQRLGMPAPTHSGDRQGLRGE